MFVTVQGKKRHWSTGRITPAPFRLRMPNLKTALAVYDCGQVYGGPEEGGWYYTQGFRVGQPVTINPHKKGARRKLQLIARRAAEVYPEAEEIYVAQDRGEFFPTRRPYYE